MYVIQATRTTVKDGWSCTVQIPTFFLDDEIQGIVSEEHAVQIAREIIGGDNVEITATKIL